jgi:hypothetical protein
MSSGSSSGDLPLPLSFEHGLVLKERPALLHLEALNEAGVVNIEISRRASKI